LKLSVFNDDKKTDLIGEAWVDLKDLVVPGGGQRDLWQELKCQRKYAGEVRMELTYYDSRPRVEKPAAPRRSSTRDMQWEVESSFGPRQQGNTKRRPLPSNPGSSNSVSIDQPRLQASGPRQFGTAPSMQARTRKDTDSSVTRQPLDSRRPLSSRQSLNPALDDEYSSHHSHQQYPSHHYSDIQDQDQYNTFEYDDHRSQTSYTSGSYMGSVQNDLLTPQEQPPLLQHSYSAPAEMGYEQHHEPPVLRRSVTEYQPEFEHHQQSVHDSFGPDHPEFMRQFSGQQIDDHHHSGYVSPEELETQPQLDYPVIDPYHVEQDYHEEAPPPPPPTHRHTTDFTNSSPGFSAQLQSWNEPEYNHPIQWSSPRQAPGIYGKEGHLASKSEVVLATYRDPHNDANYEFDQEARRSYNFDTKSIPQDHRLSMRRANSPPALSRQSYGQFDIDRDHSFDQRRNSNYEYGQRQDFYPEDHTQGHQAVGNFRSSTYRAPTHAHSSPETPQSHGGSLKSSPTGMSGLVGHNTPSRPHPLSQQHTVSSSPPHISPYQGLSIIKPLAISPAKSSQFNTPVSLASSPWASQEKPKLIPRKSISPLPAIGDANTAFSTPYSPDSYDALNPAIANKIKAPDPIVDFHGNVVDPSDRLPETSWAPEPIKKDQSPPTQSRSSPWASESESNRLTGSRNIRVRVRDRFNGSRELERQENFSQASSPVAKPNVYPSSPLNSSPAGPSPYTRNRLTKKAPNRPQPVPAPSWKQPNGKVPEPPMVNSEYGHKQTLPVVSTQLPGDTGRGSPNSGVYFTNDSPETKRDDPFALNSSMQGMNLGNSSRRIGGRRLLGFGG
jgi:hypothetical protein